MKGIFGDWLDLQTSKNKTSEIQQLLRGIGELAAVCGGSRCAVEGVLKCFHLDICPTSEAVAHRVPKIDRLTTTFCQQTFIGQTILHHTDLKSEI